MLTPALPFPASSERCAINCSGEISFSIGTAWFDIVASRAVSGKGSREGACKHTEEVLELHLCLIPKVWLERAAAGAVDGPWSLPEVWCWSLGWAISCVLEHCHTPACSSPFHSLLHALTREQLVEANATWHTAHGPLVPSSKHGLKSEPVLPKNCCSSKHTWVSLKTYLVCLADDPNTSSQPARLRSLRVWNLLVEGCRFSDDLLRWEIRMSFTAHLCSRR